MIDQILCSLIMCTVIGKLTHRLTSCAKQFTIAAIDSAKSVMGVLSSKCGTNKTGVGCHGTALGFRLVNPGRSSQHPARYSTGMLCQGIGGGGHTEAAECFALLSSLCKPNERKLACDRGLLSSVLGISSKLQVSFVVSELPSVEAWLLDFKNGSTNGLAALRDSCLVSDSKLLSGSLLIGEDWERLCAP